MSFAEANKTQLTISLGLVIALCCGTYYAGIEAGKAHGRADALEVRESRTAEIEKTLVEASTILKQIAETQKRQGEAIAALESRTGTLVTDVQVIQSKLPKR